jgi:hypothetical protein
MTRIEKGNCTDAKSDQPGLKVARKLAALNPFVFEGMK